VFLSFVLSGSAHVKGSGRTLMKLTPGDFYDSKTGEWSGPAGDVRTYNMHFILVLVLISI